MPNATAAAPIEPVPGDHHQAGEDRDHGERRAVRDDEVESERSGQHERVHHDQSRRRVQEPFGQHQREHRREREQQAVRHDEGVALEPEHVEHRADRRVAESVAEACDFVCAARVLRDHVHRIPTDPREFAAPDGPGHARVVELVVPRAVPAPPVNLVSSDRRRRVLRADAVLGNRRELRRIVEHRAELWTVRLHGPRVRIERERDEPGRDHPPAPGTEQPVDRAAMHGPRRYLIKPLPVTSGRSSTDSRPGRRRAHGGDRVHDAARGTDDAGIALAGSRVICTSHCSSGLPVTMTR